MNSKKRERLGTVFLLHPQRLLVSPPLDKVCPPETSNPREVLLDPPVEATLISSFYENLCHNIALKSLNTWVLYDVSQAHANPEVLAVFCGKWFRNLAPWASTVSGLLLIAIC